jgi:hypothetical protein
MHSQNPNKNQKSNKIGQKVPILLFGSVVDKWCKKEYNIYTVV